MPTRAKQSFDYVIRTLTDLDSVYDFLFQNAPSLNGTAILRAKYVLVVSAFDTYIHSIIEEKIMDIFSKECSYDLSRVNIPLDSFHNIICENNPILKEQLFLNALRATLSKYSYQAPRNVENALQIIGITHIWRTAKDFMGMSADDIQKKLALIVQRRNKIAHESDFDSVSMQFAELKKADVEDVTEFLCLLVEIIDTSCN